MFIYSGDSRKGKLGTPTDLKDIDGKNLFVGDIVFLLYKDECRERIEGLTAVVDDSYISYQDELMLTIQIKVKRLLWESKMKT